MSESYFGYIADPKDVQILIKAGQSGLIKMVNKKLTARDLKKIRSGSIYIWNETETNLKRWRDGRRWSASRFQGKFLVYRELFKVDHPMSYSSTNSSNLSLYKKTISVEYQNSKFRLVNYYHPNDLLLNKLTNPKQDTYFDSILTKLEIGSFVYNESIIKSNPSPYNSINNPSLPLYSINFINNSFNSNINRSPPYFKCENYVDSKEDITSLPPISSFLRETDSTSLTPVNTPPYPILIRNSEDLRQLKLIKVLFD